MNKLLKSLLPLIVLIGLTLGCGLGGGEGAPSPTEPPSGEEGESPDVEETEEGEQASLSSITSGLQNLDSYRTYFEMTFEGTTDSGAEQWVFEMNTEYVRDPFAQRILFQSDDAQGSFEIIQIGDQQYILFGDGQCMSSSIGEEDVMDMEIFDPEEVIGGLDNLNRVLPDETVNGILCRHYTFDESSIFWTGLSYVEGEVWIAVDGDYVVRYVMQAEGIDPTSQQEGYIEWEYEVRDVNTSITIEPPPSCEAAESDFPIMPDATNMTTMGGMVMYESASSFDDVLAFYQEQMPANGWSDTGDSFSSPGSAILSYTQEGSTATVTLADEGGTVSVIIVSN